MALRAAEAVEAATNPDREGGVPTAFANRDWQGAGHGHPRVFNGAPMAQRTAKRDEAAAQSPSPGATATGSRPALSAQSQSVSDGLPTRLQRRGAPPPNRTQNKRRCEPRMARSPAWPCEPPKRWKPLRTPTVREGSPPLRTATGKERATATHASSTESQWPCGLPNERQPRSKPQSQSVSDGLAASPLGPVPERQRRARGHPSRPSPRA
jgi:hypothetical protein